MLRWSTDQVDPKDRFDHWREIRAKGLFGVTAELAADQRSKFFGEFALRRRGGAGLIELRASPYKVERTLADIANAPSDSLCIYQQLGGGSWFNVAGGDFAIHNESFATSYSDRPYSTLPISDEGFHLRIVKIPMDNLPSLQAGIRDFIPQSFNNQSPLLPLLASCFADLIEAGDDDSDAPASTNLVQALARFTLIGRGVIQPKSHTALEAVRVGRFSLARRMINRDFARVQFSPAIMADALGISVRHLHMLFEAADTSFLQVLTKRRIAESCRLLLQNRELPISQVAFASGFDSSPTFYRAFHAAHAMSPGEFRAQGDTSGTPRADALR